MKKGKLRDRKEIVQETEAMDIGKKAVITMIAIVVTFVGFYFLTSYLLAKNKTNYPEFSSEIDYISFNQLLNQKEEDYFVLAQFESDKNDMIYNRYLNSIEEVELYSIDMSSVFNKARIGEDANVTDNIREIVISDTTLFVIENGKITSYYVGTDDILEFLKTQLTVD